MTSIQHFSDLPNDVIFKVLESVPALERGRVAATCKRLHDLVLDGATWAKVDSRDLGANFSDEAIKLIVQGNTHTLLLIGATAIDHGPKKLNDSGIQAVLPRLAALTTLDLTNMRHLKKETFGKIAEHCKNLRSLNVKNCRVVTDAELSAIAENCPHLTHLDLTNTKKISGAGYAVIQKLVHLTELNLWGCPDITVEALTAIVSHCKSLTKLNLRFCFNVDDDFLTVIAQQLPNLVSLDVGYNMSITPAGLNNLSTMSSLTSLCIREIYNIKPEHIAEFTGKMPQCAVAHDRDPA